MKKENVFYALSFLPIALFGVMIYICDCHAYGILNYPVWVGRLMVFGEIILLILSLVYIFRTLFHFRPEKGISKGFLKTAMEFAAYSSASYNICFFDKTAFAV